MGPRRHPAPSATGRAGHSRLLPSVRPAGVTGATRYRPERLVGLCKGMQRQVQGPGTPGAALALKHGPSPFLFSRVAAHPQLRARVESDPETGAQVKAWSKNVGPERKL